MFTQRGSNGDAGGGEVNVSHGGSGGGRGAWRDGKMGGDTGVDGLSGHVVCVWGTVWTRVVQVGGGGVSASLPLSALTALEWVSSTRTPRVVVCVDADGGSGGGRGASTGS